jgi:aspartyl protease
LLRISSAQYSNLKPLSFKVGRRTYKLNANSQIVPRTFNSPAGDDKDAIYLAVFDLGPSYSGQLSFIAGLTFLERYYTVFDADRGRVGFATTQLTNATDIN